jgi:hypothetical protein
MFKVIQKSAVVFLVTVLLVAEALSQSFASSGPNFRSGSSYDCSNPQTPCSLAEAIVDAQTRSASPEVYVLVSSTSETVVLDEELAGVHQIDGDVSLGTYTLRSGEAEVVGGVIDLNGSLELSSNSTLTLREGVQLRLVGEESRLF